MFRHTSPKRLLEHVSRCRTRHSVRRRPPMPSIFRVEKLRPVCELRGESLCLLSNFKVGHSVSSLIPTRTMALSKLRSTALFQECVAMRSCASVMHSRGSPC
jgi:hypothetical protein